MDALILTMTTSMQSLCISRFLLQVAGCTESSGVKKKKKKKNPSGRASLWPSDQRSMASSQFEIGEFRVFSVQRP